jgi:glyoxylase-like metal-dependent hydrolase (beta-lactamase superfamily II)
MERDELLTKLEPATDRYKFTYEFIVCLKLAIAELQDGFIPTYPSIVFEKNMTLDMGDMTIELFSFGGMHTDSDIVIFVPEEGLVALGDVAPEQMLPYIRKDLKSNFQVTLEHWGRIVNSKSEIKYVNMAHSDMHLSVQTFKEQYRYLHTLWQELAEMHQKGLTVTDAIQKYTIENDFSYFKDKIFETSRGSIHENNIEAIWDRISRK